MKKWMKFVVGNEPIAAQDVVAVALVGMLLGGVITWWIFAVFWGYRVFEDAGSAADWAAAAATAVVGAGAWKIARDSHAHKIAESAKIAEAGFQRTEAKYDVILGLISQMEACGTLVRETIDLESPDQTALWIAQTIRISKVWLDDIQWTDVDKTMLSFMAGARLRSLKLRYYQFKLMLENASSRTEVAIRPVTDDERVAVMQLFSVADRLIDGCKQATQAFIEARGLVRT